jgi:hypothetical protein
MHNCEAFWFQKVTQGHQLQHSLALPLTMDKVDYRSNKRNGLQLPKLL